MPIQNKFVSDRKQGRVREARLKACQDKPHLAEAIARNTAAAESKRKFNESVARLAGKGVLIPKPGIMQDGIEELREQGMKAVESLPKALRDTLRARTAR